MVFGAGCIAFSLGIVKDCKCDFAATVLLTVVDADTYLMYASHDHSQIPEAKHTVDLL